MLKTPEFWYKNTQPFLLLKAIGSIYNFFSKTYRTIQTSKKVTKPVICIGNITMGGSGKTPTALAIAAIIKDMGYLPHFSSRGYGGNIKGPVLVQTKLHNFIQVGDEPLLLASKFPCWIAKNRLHGALAAIEGGAESIIMDDGFQNTSIHKDISLLVIDGNSGFGNGCVFPAGPLRETPKDGLKRANACIILNTTPNSQKEWQSSLQQQNFSVPVFYANIVPAERLDEQRVIGFAGLGLPEKFKKTLKDCGAKIVNFYKFADHHPYTSEDINKMRDEANKSNAVLITTKKDFIRIPLDLRDTVKICAITLQWQDKRAIKAFLKEQLTSVI